MADYKCEKCNREFLTADALAMHNKAKHFGEIKQSTKQLTSLSTQNKKKIRNWTIFLIIIGIIIFSLYSLRTNGKKVNQEDNLEDKLDITLSNESLAKIPQGAVHWHPQLTIKIDGKAIEIPKNIGISIGKITDTDLSGMRMSPTHTHTNDGVIHLENNNPSAKPETLALGYFFYVWGKKFNNECIFDYCTDKGELKMYVNDKENFEFQNYFMQDNDKILIEYNSK